ncbi:hypothetical protein OG453_41470 [Streptomyces sp. NBC_01381]|uniref:hypothetical protein n=1 Tax=Streptomyces sp. NBC_01381 TaxID=2903845 RepID=UPI002252E824|nr:hypothetical protein [Streptomyces sp. NBC_01381]MCX4673033.1 hypothetical protein [Streptomyces sp. NBC_01381]
MSGETASSEPNKTLLVVLKEAGCSHAALARRVVELGRRQGVVMRYDKASVNRWLQGMQPRGRATEFIAAALSEMLNRPVAPADLGFTADPLKPVITRALSYCGDVGETLHTLAELGSTAISRRSLLGAVPFVASALLEP